MVPSKLNSIAVKISNFKLAVNYKFNIITDPEWVILVLNELEGQWNSASKEIEKAVQEIHNFIYPELDSELESKEEVIKRNPIVYTIYGPGGLNRYKIKLNGDIEFSEFHATKEDLKKAKELGMPIFN